MKHCLLVFGVVLNTLLFATPETGQPAAQGLLLEEAPKDGQTTTESKKEEPTKPESSFSVIAPKFNGLLQVWAFHDSSAYADFNFRIRRAELKVTGQLSPELKYFVMVDPAKNFRTGAISADNDNRILQDIGITYALLEGLEISAGQFKAPTTAEGLVSSSELNFPERALTARTFGDKRETGIQLAYKLKWLKAAVMGSNGGNTNTNDKNARKDLHGRLDFYLLDGLSAGGFASYSDTSDQRTHRHGLSVAAKLGGFFFNAEGATGEIDLIKTQGAYADIGYDFNKTFRPALRYEYFETETVTTSFYTAGLSHLFAQGRGKFQLSYTYLQDANTDLGTPRAFSGETGNLVIANLQATF